MPGVPFEIPIPFDYFATFAWATSGAVIGLRKNYDVVGVFAIALLSSTGGGLLRDGLLLHRVPVLLTNPVYLPLIVATTLVMCVVARFFIRVVNDDFIRKAIDVVDAAGTPAFAVYGMQLAASRELSVWGTILVGVVSGVGGGLLRDVVVRDVPALLRPGHYVTLFLALACGGFMMATQFGMEPILAAWLTIVSYFTVRVLSVCFDWQSRAVIGLPPPEGGRN